jgi:uncharacterized protein (TIGR00661 family)
MKKQKTIMVCPMDWGLGHATRVVPIIEILLKKNARVILAADNKPLEFLRTRFPQCEWAKLPGYEPFYQKKGLLALKVTADLPKMMIESKKAHDLLEKFIDKWDVDAVISDNRYELWTEKVPTIFMTHQLRIMTQGVLVATQSAIQKILYGFIEKHDEVWVPDFEGEPNLSAGLSHVKKLPGPPVFYVGPLSRFQKLKDFMPASEKPDLLCIMSGPEPQRSLLEELLVKQALKTSYKILILSGKPGEQTKRREKNVEIWSHASDEQMVSLIKSAKFVISRSGYTTVMDLATLGKQAIFIPTPQQPEQEYLAKVYKEQGLFFSQTQSKFQLEYALRQSERFSGLQIQNDYVLLNQRIAKLLE